jgi:hypothetical protein
MAITVANPKIALLAGNMKALFYTFTAAASGDTATIGVQGGVPFLTQFSDGNGNIIVSNPPTFGSWTTTNDGSTATLTANAGGVVTNGGMYILTGGG